MLQKSSSELFPGFWSSECCAFCFQSRTAALGILNCCIKKNNQSFKTRLIFTSNSGTEDSVYIEWQQFSRNSDRISPRPFSGCSLPSRICTKACFLGKAIALAWPMAFCYSHPTCFGGGLKSCPLRSWSTQSISSRDTSREFTSWISCRHNASCSDFLSRRSWQKCFISGDRTSF